MRFLKSKNISKFNISDQAIFSNPYGRTVMNGTGALLVPTGTTSQRPYISGTERTPRGPYGYVRYNTSTNTIEGYIYDPQSATGKWEAIKASGSRSIIKQTLGPGDGVQTDFGPLTIVPPNTGLASAGTGAVYDYPIIVLVENVPQISTDNYTLDFNYLGSGDTWIKFTTFVPLGKYVTIYHGFGN